MEFLKKAAMPGPIPFAFAFLSLILAPAIHAQILPQPRGLPRLSKIEVLGSTAFEPQTLLNTLRIVRIGEPYQSGALEADIEINLKGFLKQHGFIFPDVKWEEIARRDREVEVRIKVAEGLQYRLSRLELQGMTIFTRDELLPQFTLKPGEVVDFSAISDGLGRIKSLYADRRHIEFSYLPEQRLDRESRTIEIYFTIIEGLPFRIAYVGFVGCGNQMEEDRLRSVVTVRSGQLFRNRDLDESVRAINRLGLFKTAAEKDYEVTILDEKESLLGIVFWLKPND